MFERALRSSKFQAALIGLISLIVVAVLNRQEIDPNVLSGAIALLFSAYIGAVSYEDGQKAKAESAPTTTVTTRGESDVSVTKSDDTGTPPFRNLGGPR